MAGQTFIQLEDEKGGVVSIDPSLVRAVVASERGGSLIWFGHGHEVVVKDEPDIVSHKLGRDAN